MSDQELTFQAVYDEFHGKIRYYVAKLVGEAAADDVTQDVFIKIDKSLTEFEGKSKLSTWVYRIATNAALDRLRSKACRQDKQTRSLSASDEDPETGTPREDTAVEDTAPSADREIVKFEMTECIREFVDRLPPDYRTVVVLSELKDLKNREIAEILGISLDAVKIRLHRARAKLKEAFESGCTFHRDDNEALACDRKAPGSTS